MALEEILERVFNGYESWIKEKNFEINANTSREENAREDPRRAAFERPVPTAKPRLALNPSVWNPSYVDMLESGRSVAFRSNRSNVSRRNSRKVDRKKHSMCKNNKKIFLI